MSQDLQELLLPVVESLGCELWGIELLPQGKRKMLRIYIDNPEAGIGIEDCEKVSRQVSALLDVEDPIVGEYVLEVSSPGMDRPFFKLEQYQRFVGEDIKLRLRIPFEGRRKFQGQLVAVENDEIVLRVDSEEYLFTVDMIDKANIVPRFEG